MAEACGILCLEVMRDPSRYGVAVSAILLVPVGRGVFWRFEFAILKAGVFGGQLLLTWLLFDGYGNRMH